MLKSQRSVLIAAAIATVATVALFKIGTGLPYLRLPFLAAVALFGANFLICTGAYYSESEAKKLGTNRSNDPRSYKRDAVYARASVAAIAIFLVPVLVLLVTMLLNQRDIVRVPFWVQLLITIGGFFFTRLISVVYEVGYTGTIRPIERAPQPPLVPPVESEKSIEKEALRIARIVLKHYTDLDLDDPKYDLDARMRSMANEEVYCKMLGALAFSLEKQFPGRKRVLDVPMFVIHTPQMRCYDKLRGKYGALVGDAYWIAIAKGMLDELPTMWDHMLFFSDIIRYHRRKRPF